ncbi:unnamed protein product [Symbiodinium sp. KB8]|nr:unnamed protein product [Symbiodinium sp. KB8]
MAKYEYEQTRQKRVNAVKVQDENLRKQARDIKDQEAQLEKELEHEQEALTNTEQQLSELRSKLQALQTDYRTPGYDREHLRQELLSVTKQYKNEEEKAHSLQKRVKSLEDQLQTLEFHSTFLETYLNEDAKLRQDVVEAEIQQLQTRH